MAFRFFAWQVRELSGISRSSMTYGMTLGFVKPLDRQFRKMYLFTIEDVYLTTVASRFLRDFKVPRAWELAHEALADSTVRDAVARWIHGRIDGHDPSREVLDHLLSDWLDVEVWHKDPTQLMFAFDQ